MNDKNGINYSVRSDSHALDENSEIVLKETETSENISFNDDNNIQKENSQGKAIFESNANNGDSNTELCGINEKNLFGIEAASSESECSKDFQFEAKGVKLTCKPSSKSDSVEVKFRHLEDKTTLAFKTGYKKLYLKMASKDYKPDIN